MNASLAMERARRVADTVLYEGYVLYPYRASAGKNRIRWQFGVLAPRLFSEADGSEEWALQTECIVEAGAGGEVSATVRFLRVQTRGVEEAVGDDRFVAVPSLDVDGRFVAAWDEAVEEEIHLSGVRLRDIEEAERVEPLDLAGSNEIELVVDQGGRLRGRIVRHRLALSGAVRLRASAVEGAPDLVKLQVRVENLTPWCEVGAVRDEVVRRSMAGVHLVLAASDAAFVSMIDPSEEARAAVASCRNLRTWPVLIGEEGARDVVLSAPITLYDYPEVAPESGGDFCDATEIDEILALRVMTLTDEEKRQARGTDARAAEIVDRCDSMPPEIMERLHGAVRSLRMGRDTASAAASEPARGDDEGFVAFGGPGMEPSGHVGRPEAPWWDPGADASVNPFEDTVMVAGVEVRKGTRVLLRPGRGSDAQDLFIAGFTAVVEGVFHDVDGDVHVAVSLEDDPATELHQWYGRYRYFRPDELVPAEAP